MSRTVVSCIRPAVRVAVGEDLGEAVESLPGADGHHHVAALEAELRAGRRDHLSVPQDRHDRDARAGARLGLAEVPTDPLGTGGNRDLFGEQPGGLLAEPG
jgi:hypothetical protein